MQIYANIHIHICTYIYISTHMHMHACSAACWRTCASTRRRRRMTRASQRNLLRLSTCMSMTPLELRTGACTCICIYGCFFYHFIRNSLVALLEALFARKYLYIHLWSKDAASFELMHIHIYTKYIYKHIYKYVCTQLCTASKASLTYMSKGAAAFMLMHKHIYTNVYTNIFEHIELPAKLLDYF